MKPYKIISIALITLFIIFSCRKKDEVLIYDSSAKLELSADTILFDTIFSSVGSITKRFWVHNRNKNAVKVSAIELGGKSTSSYTIIIDGQEEVVIYDKEIRGGDSLYVLVKVLINPQSQDLPYLVEDSIVFTTNGNIQKTYLLAYGQDANFYNNVTLPCNDVWSDKKPYVIYNKVVVPASCTLTINKNVRVLFHNGAYMKVDGTLLVQGEKDSLVLFNGDKLGTSSENLFNQWQGIKISTGSKNNSIAWAIIKNAVTGIEMSPEADADTIPELLIHHTIIKNMTSYGINANSTDIYGYNNLINNCAAQLLKITAGGNYHFKHCTFANYSTDFFRENAAISISNFSGDLKGSFKNTILWGDRTNELILSNNGVNGFDFRADSSILKTTSSVVGMDNKLNIDPLFENSNQKDFHVKAGSPAIDAAGLSSVTDDLEGKLRGSNPDIGAYEK